MAVLTPRTHPVQVSAVKPFTAAPTSALRSWSVGLALTLLLAAGLAAVQFSTPNLAGNDGFYHIQMAYLMRTEGLKPDFVWLPLTVLNAREYYDHHFLFHIALIPFTFFDLKTGAKLAAVVFACLAFLSIWRLLKGQRVPYAGLWALGLMGVSEAFLYQMSILSAQPLSLAVLVLGLHWMLAEKYKRLLPLGFLYVWLFNGFPLLLAAALVYTISLWLSERRVTAEPLLFSAAGLALGLVINPFFPYDLIFILRQLLPTLVGPTAASVGSEAYTYPASQGLQNSWLALAVLTSGILAVGWSGKKMSTAAAAALLLSLLTGLMLFQERRFGEYFPAFALVFAAFAWAPALSEAAAAGRAKRWVGAGLLAAVVVGGVWAALTGAQVLMRTSKPHTLFSGASAWLAANTQPGERIFQTGWEDFPRLFFYNTHNTYLVGLDPTYLQLYNPGLYDQWAAVRRGLVETPSGVILHSFGSRYVISDLEHTGFLAAAAQDPAMQAVYRDEEAVIFLAGGE